MRILTFLFALGLLTTVGCADRPEVSPKAYGVVVKELPRLEEAVEPFKFPYAGENDHRDCVFNEEDFF